MTIICAHCGQKRPHEARGLCRCCYEKARVLGLLDAYPKKGRRPAPDRRVYWKVYYQARKGS